MHSFPGDRWGISAMASIPAANARLGQTLRVDRWWVEPLRFGLIFGAFILYSGWVILQGAQNEHHVAEPYLSPFYSPHFSGFVWPDWWPGWLRTPALLILWAPLSFRITCYYYRRSYYRSYFLSPPACAVGRLNLPYSGERRLLIWQNLHRYALPFALALVVIFVYDAILAFFFSEGFGVGLGTVLMVVNAVSLGGYVLGCHSLRHLVGGRVDCFSCSLVNRTRGRLWKIATFFNLRHGNWAWFSLIWVALVDVYVRLVATETVIDPRLILIAA